MFIKKRWRSRHWVLAMIVMLSAAACIGVASGARQSRLSGGVAFPIDSPEHQRFMANPGVGYFEAHFRFGDDMPDDVIMFVDQELLEGLTRHRWVKGGDWMAFVGVQRAGGVWVGGGNDKALRGEPSRERTWVIRDLKQRLEPDVWYRMRIVADFGQRKFVSVSIVGGKIDQTFDLSNIPLDYPNYMPFDRGSMIYIVGVMRGRGMMKREGTPVAYFDDLEAGVVLSGGERQRLFREDFEQQTEVRSQPITAPTISLNNYQLGRWYLERDESIFRVEDAPFARSGKRVGVADGNLNK